MSMLKAKAVDEGLLTFELVCKHHDEAGVRVFVDLDTEHLTILCRTCGEEVANSAPPTPCLPPKGRVH